VNKKIGLLSISILILVIAFVNVTSTFAQVHWDYCKLSAYGTNVAEEVIGEIERTVFNVVEPPTGSDITNTVEVTDYATGENYSLNLPVGISVTIRYEGINPINYTMVPASESNHYIIYYEGEVVRVAIAGTDVPEFPPILIVPLFMTATLLALIYRRKRMK